MTSNAYAPTRCAENWREKKHTQMAAEDVKFAYPDPNETMSKRQWEKAVAAWRAALRRAARAAELEGDLSGPPDT